MKQKVIKDYSKEQTQNFVNTIISKHYACEKPSVKYIGGGSFGYVYKVEIPVSPYKLIVTDDWGKFVQEQKKQDIDAIITEQRLKPEETIKFIDNSFRDGVLKTTGTDIDKIMPPVSRFGSAGKNRSELKQKIIDILQRFFEKYRGLF